MCCLFHNCCDQQMGLQYLVFFFICSGAQLQLFIDSMRTQFGRISKTKSGQGTVAPSPRDEWVTATFGFLEGHIIRMKSRSSVSTDSNNKKK